MKTETKPLLHNIVDDIKHCMEMYPEPEVAFICRAVNSHEEMLAVLLEVASMLPVSAHLHPQDLHNLQKSVVEAIARAEARP